MPNHVVSFSESSGCVTWEGKIIVDADEFNAYLRGPVRSRLIDQGNSQQFEADLQALATTGMAIDTLRQILMAPETEREPWEVGEALAECLLEEMHNVKWPWNMVRDRRTPKASLPGADLVGFIITTSGTLLLFGEVKTSNDISNPPNVMYGRSGMISQLDNLANNCQNRNCLIKWLYHRCKNAEFGPLFQEAVTQYLHSGGQDFVLFGLLMRDTNPHILDLQNRAIELASVVANPTKVELNAWYLPTPINQWPSLVAGAN